MKSDRRNAESIDRRQPGSLRQLPSGDAAPKVIGSAEEGDPNYSFASVVEEAVQRNRKLVEVNEQLVLASMQLQVTVEKIEKAKQEMAHLAYHDVLTSLPNRAQLFDRIEQAILFAKRRPAKLAVLFLDLDRFKVINDSHGHAIGDQLLQSVAQRLTSVVRDSDTVSRHGGDEFILLLSDVSEGEGLNQKIAEIHKAITAPYRIAESTLEVGATIGISIFPEDGEDSDTLIRNADTAMYDAKQSGRNRYRYFRRAARENEAKRPVMESDLRWAVEKMRSHCFAKLKLLYKAMPRRARKR